MVFLESLLVVPAAVFKKARIVLLVTHQAVAWASCAEYDVFLIPNSCIPTEVTAIDDTVSIKQVRCGYDGTMFLTDTGALLACGRFVQSSFAFSIQTGFENYRYESDNRGKLRSFQILKKLSNTF